MNKGEKLDMLMIANQELAFQNEEKEKRAAELVIANKELVFQNEEKEKRAAELVIANKELVFQNEEKEKRAAELVIANQELVFQNEEKEKRAAELVIANKELVFQNEEKEKRAAELVIANQELVFQNEEKEKRAAELVIANQELVAFTYISSHDLQEPLRKIQTFTHLILQKEHPNLSDTGKDYFSRIHVAADRMRSLLEALLTYSQTSLAERKFINTNLNKIINEVQKEFLEAIEKKNAVIEVNCPDNADIIPLQFSQLIHHLISNSLKFSSSERRPYILITSKIGAGSTLNEKLLACDKIYCHICFTDNGIGFEPHFSQRIFEVFQRLHHKDRYPGTGIGLAIVKRIIENHNAIITAHGELNKGAVFNIYMPF